MRNKGQAIFVCVKFETCNIPTVGEPDVWPKQLVYRIRFMVSLQVYSATGKLKKLGVLAHIYGQARGFAAMLTGSADSLPDASFSTNVFDDASMWVRDPVAAAPPAERATWSAGVLQRLKDRLGRKGRNVHLPVLNSCENVFVARYSYLYWTPLLLSGWRNSNHPGL